MPGILTALTHASAHGGGSVSWSVGDTRTGAYKVKSFNARPRLEGSGLPILNSPGRWPTNLVPREMVVDLEGLLVGSDPSDYWTKRAALIKSVVPPPTMNFDTRFHGTLTATFPGQSAVYLEVSLADMEAVITAQSGRSGEYRFSWVAWFGYWRKVSDDSVVLI